MNGGDVIGIAVVFFAVGSFFGAMAIQKNLDTWREESFSRGHMVECVGKTGYYWECEK